MEILKKHRILIAACALIICLGFGIFGWIKYSESRRYYMVLGKNGIAYKIDRKTGRTWYIQRGRMIEIDDFAAEPEPATVTLPRDVIVELEGTGGYDKFYSAGLSGTTSFFKGQIYNPTDYFISSVTFVVHNEEAGDKKWRREFVADVTINPKSVGRFSFDTLNGNDAGATKWGIVSVRGRLER